MHDLEKPIGRIISTVCLLVLLSGVSVQAQQLPNQFQRVELIQGLKNSVNFEFAPDGRIFIIDRYGEVIIYNPNTLTSTSAGIVPVFHELEDGLLGIEFDPNFLSNNYIYLHYSPVTPSVNRVSRFTMNGDQLNLASEVVLMEWATQRDICCHAAGDMDFDSQGNLYIATGDNTNHSDYATLDETDSNKSSENTASNTNDPRGKILRITPQADGSYTIPSGNLFPGGAGGLPEIYVMGARNPYRIFVDSENTDWLFWGEVGPDANNPGVEGPEGMDEINLTKEAGNFGWPYFSGDNQPYRNNYAATPFYYDPAAPVNLSQWNTGATNLPPAQPAWRSFFHKCFLAGPRYYYDPSNLDQQKLPVEFDEAFFYFDFNTSRIWVVQMDEQGNILAGYPKLLASSLFPASKDGFIELKIGPDGHLYILEYGEGCCVDNAGSGKLVRLDYTGIVSNASPVVSLTADPTNGSLPLLVTFSSAGTFDPDGDPLTYEWDFDGDGTVDSNQENPTYNYTVAGAFDVLLTVRDDQGGVSAKNVTIHAGNNAATFNFVSPPDGGLIGWDDDISLEVSGMDVEDGVINCADINVVPSIGHLNHFHDDLTVDGCAKTMHLDPQDHDINGEMDIFFVLGVNYTDAGGLISFDQILLHPKRKEAEYYDLQNDIVVINNTDPWDGGTSAIRVNDNSYIVFEGRNLSGINSVKYRVASGGTGGDIELRLDSPTGTLISSTAVGTTGGWNNWVDVESAITDPGGKHDLYIVFKNTPGAKDLLSLNWVEFSGNGVSMDNSPPTVNEVAVINETSLSIEFSEPVTKISAENIGSYQIDGGILISSATLQEDGRSVILNISALSAGQDYIVFINGVQNLSGLEITPGNHSFRLFDSIRINSGGPQITANGAVFTSDQYADAGELFDNTVNIDGTSNDALYQTERWGDFTYNIPVTNQGTFDIRLHFAEIYFGVDISGGVGSRVFNVSIEGNQVLSNFDILTEVAPATALVKEFNDVAISDGFASIQFTSLVENAKISAIEILDPNTFDATPDITILTPGNGASVGQPFSVGFRVDNWEVQEGSTHMHYYIDGQMIGPHYSLDPISIDGLSLGSHTIRIELFEAGHTGTGIYDEVTVTVTDQVSCITTEFPDQWDEHLIDGALPYRSVYILPQQDIDGDGLKDIVTGGWWYKNPGSAGGNWIRSTIGNPFNNVAWIYDFDGDGDQDLFGSQGAYESADLAWAENDGSGNFTVHTNIPSGTTNFGEIFIAGVAGGVFQTGGPYQLALAWNGAEDDNSQIQVLTIPADPVNTAWTIDNLHPTSLGEALTAGDIDGDGDLDLFQTENWLRNDQGSWTLFNTGITYTSHVDRNALADFDRDGDLDGVAGQLLNNREIAWFEAPEDPTQLWTKHTIHPSIDGSLSVGVADMDFDGDMDIVVGEWKGANKLFGFENDLCASGDWITHTIDAGGNGLDHHDGSQLVDIDDDGDLDIITIGWDNITPRIFENLSDPVVQNLPPVLNAPSNQSFQSGAAVNYQISGADPNPGDVLTYSATGLPGNLTIDGTTGLISGQLTATLGDYPVTVRLTDQDGLFDEKQFTISVTGAGNVAPELTNPGNQVYNGGSIVSLQIEGSDPNSGDILNYSATGLPTGLSMDASSGLISGTLTATAGNYPVTIRVTDQEGLFEEEQFTIVITDFETLLRINSGGPGFTFGSENWAQDQYFNSGALFSTTAAIAGTTNDQLYQTERFAENGTMSYAVPLPAGEYQVRLHFAEIYHTAAGARIFDVDIENGQATLTDYDIFVAAGGANTARIETFMVTVNDGTLNIDFSSTTELAKISGIEISGAGNVAPVVSNPGNQYYNVGSMVSLQLQGQDLNQGDVLSYSASGLPAGLSINAGSGLINGTLSAPVGDYQVVVRVTDQEGLFDEESFVISVTEFNTFLRINAGGPGFSFNGEEWMADQYFNGGEVFSTTDAIAGTLNDQLYQTERFNETGALNYAIPVSSGDYLVELHFAEIYHENAGDRVFDVDIESGQGTLVDYDIFVAAGGGYTAIIESFNVTVSDGVLDIAFNNKTELAKISGIEISGVSSDNQPPEVVPVVAQTVAEGGTLEVNITATDPDGEIPSLMVDVLPPFASFTDNLNGTGSLNLSPGFNDRGTYNITVTATDPSGLTDSEIIIIQVIDGNGAPILQPISNVLISEGEQVSVPLSASDPDGEKLTLSISDAPDFVIFNDHNDGTGELLITPGYLDAGTYSMTVEAIDPEGLRAGQVVNITVQDVNGPPEVVVQTNITVEEGTTVQIPVSSEDPDDEVPSFSLTDIPPFISIIDNGNGTGTLEISPPFNALGSFSFSVRATDASGFFGEQVIQLVVTETGSSANWQVEAQIANANCLNELGSIALTVTGGLGELSYQWSHGAETKDLQNLSAGVYSVTITDQKDNVTTRSFTVNVQPGPQKPTISNQDGILTSEVVAFSYQWHFDGEEIDGATGRTLEPTLAGEYSLAITDDLGCVSQSDPITVDFELNSLSFYPNPSSGDMKMSLTLVEDQQITFRLIDDTGKDHILGVFDLKAGRHVIDLTLDESLANGAYTILTDQPGFEKSAYRILLIR